MISDHLFPRFGDRSGHPSMVIKAENLTMRPRRVATEADPEV